MVDLHIFHSISARELLAGNNIPSEASGLGVYFHRTTDVTGVAHLPEGTEMVMPGDNVTIKGELIHPIAMEEGLKFAIREGGRTVGSGRVTKIFK